MHLHQIISSFLSFNKLLALGVNMWPIYILLMREKQIRHKISDEPTL